MIPIMEPWGSGGSYAVSTNRYDSSLLRPMSRKIGRERWGIDDHNFVGIDVWHCYESSFLLEMGLPIAGILKIVYDAKSPYMIESKSLKLYLNSFDMCKMGVSLKEARLAYEFQIEKDLSSVLDTEVSVKFFDSSAQLKPFPFTEYKDIVKELQAEDEFEVIDYESGGHGRKIKFNRSKESVDFTLNLGNEGEKRSRFEVRYSTNILRSRCYRTKQKDTGTVFLSHASDRDLIEEESFLRMIISLREVNEFHEIGCEQIFEKILKQIQLEDDLMLAMLYNRRGGIDINPIRATSWNMIPKNYIDVKTLTLRTMSQ